MSPRQLECSRNQILVAQSCLPISPPQLKIFSPPFSAVNRKPKFFISPAVQSENSEVTVSSEQEAPTCSAPLFHLDMLFPRQKNTRQSHVTHTFDYFPFWYIISFSLQLIQGFALLSPCELNSLFLFVRVYRVSENTQPPHLQLERTSFELKVPWSTSSLPEM